jgi:hypothetical protein
MHVYAHTLQFLTNANLIIVQYKPNNLCIFERQILRKIFGPVNTDNIWRIQNNMEIDKLIEGADISEIH